MCKFQRGAQGTSSGFVTSHPVRRAPAVPQSPPGLPVPPGLSVPPGLQATSVTPATVAAERNLAETKLAAFAAAVSQANNNMSASTLPESKKNRIGQAVAASSRSAKVVPTQSAPTATGKEARKAAGKGPRARQPPLQWHPCYKKKLCMWYEDGLCRNGDQCHFAHGPDELRGGWSSPLAKGSSSPTSPSSSASPPRQAPVAKPTAAATPTVAEHKLPAQQQGPPGLDASADEPMKIDLQATRKMEAAACLELLSVVAANAGTRQVKPDLVLASGAGGARSAGVAVEQALNFDAMGPAQLQEALTMLTMQQQLPSLCTDLQKLKTTVQLLSFRCQQIQHQMMVESGLAGFAV